MGASGSSIISARLLVTAGISRISNGGFTLAPSQVNLEGINPLGSNSGLEICKVLTSRKVDLVLILKGDIFMAILLIKLVKPSPVWSLFCPYSNILLGANFNNDDDHNFNVIAVKG
jgi:hypothetical protein